jgi:hypothetical protein
MAGLFAEKFETDVRGIEYEFSVPHIGRFGYASANLLFWGYIGLVGGCKVADRRV